MADLKNLHKFLESNLNMHLAPVDGVVVLAVYGNEVRMLECIQQTVIELTADWRTSIDGEENGPSNTRSSPSGEKTRKIVQYGRQIQGPIKRARNESESEMIVPAPNPKIEALLPKISGVGLLSVYIITYDVCCQWGRRSLKLHSAAHQMEHRPINDQVASCDGEQVERAWSQVAIKKCNLKSDWL
ncbi:hypothetical protein B0H14DRAFT_2585751 [Mycena olivaceomarginata]|nr:hypothetical protein B0H14DRAFT_2585751 [Mycena olivaceomarginata]